MLTFEHTDSRLTWLLENCTSIDSAQSRFLAVYNCTASDKVTADVRSKQWGTRMDEYWLLNASLLFSTTVYSAELQNMICTFHTHNSYFGAHCCCFGNFVALTCLQRRVLAEAIMLALRATQGARDPEAVWWIFIFKWALG